MRVTDRNDVIIIDNLATGPAGSPSTPGAGEFMPEHMLHLMEAKLAQVYGSLRSGLGIHQRLGWCTERAGGAVL